MDKCNKIRHIVRLRQMLRRWRQRASVSSSSPPPDVPAGHVAVCVGRMARRFVVRASHLNHPVLRQLLHQAEEEYGFPSGRTGPVALPCVDEALFEHLLRHISSSRFRNCSLEDFEIMLSFIGGDLCQFSGDLRPLLRGHRHAEKTVH
ncbi:indole-3-acetic acid-induced protein ARG7-like [Zingiber officinale]|uniref:indole-3-acetic acid-induced protein ARG7-like n=1 Tax=Zingiber officinale TaxID=94328 RepID=UPI001C4C41AE|nr:indole-3-acetic acid-induced protein ARG7-like [Zingiber officinale]